MMETWFNLEDGKESIEAVHSVMMNRVGVLYDVDVTGNLTARACDTKPVCLAEVSIVFGKLKHQCNWRWLSSLEFRHITRCSIGELERTIESQTSLHLPLHRDAAWYPAM